jgi:excisionase family DNA binding protein
VAHLRSGLARGPASLQPPSGPDCAAGQDDIVPPLSQITDRPSAVLVSAAEAARLLGQSRHQLYRWIASGFLPAAAVRRIGRSIRIEWSAVHQWLVELKGEAYPLDHATGDPSQAPVVGGCKTR